jgi:hypothetical protein
VNLEAFGLANQVLVSQEVQEVHLVVQIGGRTDQVGQVGVPRVVALSPVLVDVEIGLSLLAFLDKLALIPADWLNWDDYPQIGLGLRFQPTLFLQGNHQL